MQTDAQAEARIQRLEELVELQRPKPSAQFSLLAEPADGVERNVGSLQVDQKRTYFFRATFTVRDTVTGKGQASVLRTSIQGDSDPLATAIIGSTSEFSQNNMTVAGIVNARLAGTTLTWTFVNAALNTNPVNVQVDVEVFYGAPA